MSNQKHVYMNQVVWSSHSGENGDTLNEIVWRQYYDDKVEQIEEQQNVVPAVIGAITSAVMPRAEKGKEEVRRTRGQ